MTRIVVAFDSFKGSLTSYEAGDAFVRGFRDVEPTADATLFSVADGGEGMAEAVVRSIGGELIATRVHDPLGRDIEARYAIVHEGNTAIIAMSATSGLTLVEPTLRNPSIATTYGTGELIRDAIERGCRDIVVGLGGSATNDGGAGMLRALGYRFYDVEGRELCDTMTILEGVHSISDEGCIPLNGINIVVATDVDIPLCGAHGATHIFAPQKGADDAMVMHMESAMCHYATVVDDLCGHHASTLAGAGAAGGVGYAMAALLDAPLHSGIDMVLDLVLFDRAIEGADIVITGEGRIDAQTLMGKAPAGVLRRARRYGVPCVAVGGSVVWRDIESAAGFDKLFSATPEGMPLSDAMHHATAIDNLYNAGRAVALWWHKYNNSADR